METRNMHTIRKIMKYMTLKVIRLPKPNLAQNPLWWGKLLVRIEKKLSNFYSLHYLLSEYNL